MFEAFPGRFVSLLPYVKTEKYREYSSTESS